MKVLVLGLPRTGTQSIADALAILGIAPVYHMREVAKSGHQDLWIEALETKFEGKGPQWGREDFERILKDYNAVSDYPAAIFPEELIAAYPEAVIILSTRDESGWINSMMSTVWHAHVRTPIVDTSKASLRLKYNQHCWDNDFPANGSRVFKEHNALVKRCSVGRNFLEYWIGSGWEPICEFLGVPVPPLPYPRSDDWAEYKRQVQAENDSMTVMQ